MHQQIPSQQLLPSFSLVLETENLANADLDGLQQAIASLAQQDIPLTTANEVLIIDTGDTPLHLLQWLCSEYPWLKIHHAPASTGYYKAKLLGAALVTGEVVVYADADCIYEPSWLRHLLTPFGDRHDIQIVAGETRTRGVGPYGTAMALAYIFPQYSGELTLAPTQQYFLNNVAFRREFLLAHPIPVALPLYRGNCVIHAQALRSQGQIIWRQPLARATHAPPDGLSHFFWRFLLIGYDYYWQHRLLTDDRNQHDSGNTPVRAPDPMAGTRGKLAIFRDRIHKMRQDDPRHLAYLPLALPIVLAAAILILIGYRITVAQPDYLLKTYSRILDVT